MQIAELWRYPVKSMGGEQLRQAALHADGIEGDRLIRVEDAAGRVITARTKPRLLSHHATIGDDGEVLVDGAPWQSDEVARAVERSAGPGTRLVRHEAADRFDILPLLVATDGALAALGYDRRRFRPNILLAGVEGFAERGWEGRRLFAGDCVIELVDLRQRCVMTTYDPDTQVQDPRVLRRIVQELGGLFALNAAVVRGGTLRVDDPAQLA